MYSFLMLVGIIILGLGLYIDRKKIEPEVKIEHLVDIDLINRLEALETTVYSSKIENEDLEARAEEISQDEFLAILEREKEQVEIDNLDIRDEMREKFKVIADYDRGVYSLEEVCKTLDMQKGEVLLLKNFYKKYKE